MIPAAKLWEKTSAKATTTSLQTWTDFACWCSKTIAVVTNEIRLALEDTQAENDPAPHMPVIRALAADVKARFTTWVNKTRS